MTPKIRMATEDEAKVAKMLVCFSNTLDNCSLDDSLEVEDVIEAYHDDAGNPYMDVYVRENYVTGGPGFVGDVMFIHFDGDPTYIAIAIRPPNVADNKFHYNITFHGEETYHRTFPEYLIAEALDMLNN